MPDPQTTIRAAYTAFNTRDIDAALALMTEDVDWPKASEGGSVIGKPAIRTYWGRQWADFDPHVDPLDIREDPQGRFRVRVHQLVKNLNGEVLSDTEVLHIFTLSHGLIASMALGSPTDPTAAFPHHP